MAVNMRLPGLCVLLLAFQWIGGKASARMLPLSSMNPIYDGALARQFKPNKNAMDYQRAFDASVAVDQMGSEGIDDGQDVACQRQLPETITALTSTCFADSKLATSSFTDRLERGPYPAY